MNIKAFVGLLDSNTYVVSSDSGNAMIIDAGAPPSELFAYVKEKGLTVKFIVLTHGHFDHADYVADYISEYKGATPICHEDEVKVLRSPDANVSNLLGVSRTYDYDFTLIKNGDVLLLGDLEFKLLNLPGHTPGSICLLCEKERALFTGDVLFSSSYGRTDFLYGSPQDMMESLRALSRLDKEITIYPGHDGCEKLKNIFRY